MRCLRLPGLAALVFLIGFSAQAQYVEGDSAATRKDGPPSTYSSQPPAIPRKPVADKPPFLDRLHYGGNFGLSFGTYTYVELSPLVVYDITDRFQAGPGATYIYMSYNQAPYKYSTSIYGGRIFGRYLLFENLFAQTELEVLNLKVGNEEYQGRYTIFNPYVGGGYRVPLGDRGGVYLTALYNLNYHANLAYTSSPFVLRVGFTL